VDNFNPILIQKAWKYGFSVVSLWGGVYIKKLSNKLDTFPQKMWITFWKKAWKYGFCVLSLLCKLMRNNMNIVVPPSITGLQKEYFIAYVEKWVEYGVCLEHALLLAVDASAEKVADMVKK